jgi:hypothetical protein
LIGKKRKPATENGAKDSGSVPKAAKQSEPVPTMEVAEVSETPKKQVGRPTIDLQYFKHER